MERPEGPGGLPGEGTWRTPDSWTPDQIIWFIHDARKPAPPKAGKLNTRLAWSNGDGRLYPTREEALAALPSMFVSNVEAEHAEGECPHLDPAMCSIGEGECKLASRLSGKLSHCFWQADERAICAFRALAAECERMRGRVADLERKQAGLFALQGIEPARAVALLDSAARQARDMGLTTKAAGFTAIEESIAAGAAPPPPGAARCGGERDGGSTECTPQT